MGVMSAEADVAAFFLSRALILTRSIAIFLQSRNGNVSPRIVVSSVCTSSFGIFDIQEINVHGGSLRIFLKHKNNSSIKISKNVKNTIQQEKKFGLQKLETYSNFQKKITKSKMDIWKFLQKTSLEKKSIVGYGAPAKACTVLNFCGIKNDLLPFTVDVSIEKQGLHIPGTNIPIYLPK